MNEGARELARLLEGLHYRGLAVGVDDAERVARVFRHAAGWSRERRVRALKALLSRTPEERRVIDELSSFLFVARGDDPALEQAEPPEPRGVESRYPSRKLSLSGRARQPKSSDLQTTDRRTAPARKPLLRRATLVLITASFSVTAIVIALVAQHFAGSRQGPPLGEATSGAGSSERKVPAGSSATPATPRSTKALPELDPWQPVCAASGPPPWVAPWLERAKVGLVPLALLGYAYLFWRSRTGRRQAENVRRLVQSEGPRLYELDYREGGLAPLDREALREAAFQLSAPTQEVVAPWIHVRETLLATVRNVGLVTLEFERFREHTPVLVLEDVSRSMARWPLHGDQVSEAFARQGAGAQRYFFDRDPTVLYASRDLEAPLLLESALPGGTRPVIVVLSDASALDGQRGADPPWLPHLASATWLHPQPAELWNGGARWLCRRLCVAPASPEGLSRLRALGVERVLEPPPVWEPPRVPGMRPEGTIAAYRSALGEQAFFLLCAAALLESHGSFSARMLAALREHVIDAPWHLTERIWTFPGLDVGADGSVRLAPELSRLLVQALERERPELGAHTLEFARGLVEHDLLRLGEAAERRSDPEPRTMAGLLARVARARLDARSEALRGAALSEVRHLSRAGFGDIVATRATATERKDWDLGRLRRVRPLSPRAVALGFALLPVALLPAAFGDRVLEWVGPQQKGLELLWPGRDRWKDVWLSSPPKLYACDASGASEELLVRMGPNPEIRVRREPLRDGSGALFDLGEAIGPSTVAVKELALSLADPTHPSRGGSWQVWVVPRPRLSAELEGGTARVTVTLSRGVEWPRTWRLHREGSPEIAQTFEISGERAELLLPQTESQRGLYLISARDEVRSVTYASEWVQASAVDEPPASIAAANDGEPGPAIATPPAVTAVSTPPKPSRHRACLAGNAGACKDVASLIERQTYLLDSDREALRAACKAGYSDACQASCVLLGECRAQPPALCSRVCGRLKGCPIGDRLECVSGCTETLSELNCRREVSEWLHCVEPYLQVKNCEMNEQGIEELPACKGALEAVEACEDKARPPPVTEPVVPPHPPGQVQLEVPPAPAGAPDAGPPAAGTPKAPAAKKVAPKGTMRREIDEAK